MALKLLQNRFESGLPLPLHTWILDSLPGMYSIEQDKRRTGSNSVVKVLEHVASLPKIFPSKEGMIQQLQNDGIDKGIALWLATNIVSINKGDPEGGDASGGYRWGFNMAVVQALFTDFCDTDMWPFLHKFAATSCINSSSASNTSSTIHFLRAGKNQMWTDEILGQFQELKKFGGNVKLHTMGNVGHWLHAENLNGMYDIISKEGV